MEIKTHLDFDYRGIGKIFNDLEKAETFAVKRTLSKTAFNTMQDARVLADKKLILRNTFSKRNIVYQNTTGSTIANMESKAGATKRAEHMAFQKTGGKRTGKGGGDMLVPTDKARVGGSNKRLVSKKNYTKVAGMVRGALKRNGPTRSNLVARAFVSWKNKLLLRHSLGVYRVLGFSKSSSGIDFKMERMYSIKKSTTSKARPWIEPSAEMNAIKMQDVYNEEMDKSVDRWMKGKFK